MKPTEIHIREGNAADMPAIMELIKELADYEKALNEVKNTPETLKNDFSNGWFSTLVAEVPEDHIVGMALYHPAYSTWKGKMWYLDDLVVTSQWRKMGVGKALLDHLLKKADKAGVSLIKWQVLEWNEPAIRFYEKYPVSFDKEWWNCKILLE
jgi:GNAT superfamily N-acetyltransferase